MHKDAIGRELELGMLVVFKGVGKYREIYPKPGKIIRFTKTGVVLSIEGRRDELYRRFNQVGRIS